MKIITQFDMLGQEIEISQKDDGTYDVFVDGENKQPNHDVEGIIRYLSHMAFNAGYLHDKVKKENDELKNNVESVNKKMIKP